MALFTSSHELLGVLCSVQVDSHCCTHVYNLGGALRKEDVLPRIEASIAIYVIQRQGFPWR